MGRHMDPTLKLPLPTKAPLGLFYLDSVLSTNKIHTGTIKSLEFLYKKHKIPLKANKIMKVKKGWLVVEVEEELQEGEGRCQRFEIPISYLYHPLFKRLLDKAYEVYGYQTEGPLKLPCSIDDFLHLRWRIQKESTPHHHHHNHLHHQLPHALYFHSC
ncbi:hypothetical protein RJT34_03093 [Clitoria ternatea]|uniref:Uncharacterized protein n=1 Tax=Clitoria ternatea TaxID=43366 RepID=A0AAN9Q271_CLITE